MRTTIVRAFADCPFAAYTDRNVRDADRAAATSLRERCGGGVTLPAEAAPSNPKGQ